MIIGPDFIFVRKTYFFMDSSFWAILLAPIFIGLGFGHLDEIESSNFIQFQADEIRRCSIWQASCVPAWLLHTPHPKLDSSSSSLFSTFFYHRRAETLLGKCMATTVMVVMSMSVPAPYSSCLDMKERVYAMRGGIRSLLDDKDVHTCSSDGYNSSNIAYHHFISMLLVQTVEAQQYKHRGRAAHSSVIRSIHIHPRPSTHISWGVGTVSS